MPDQSDDILQFYVSWLPNKADVDLFAVGLSGLWRSLGEGQPLLSALLLQTSGSLDYLLIEYSTSLSSDPRDRLFALLGVFPQHHRRMLKHFFPEYSINYCLVTLLMCAYLLHRTYTNVRTVRVPTYHANDENPYPLTSC